MARVYKPTPVVAGLFPATDVNVKAVSDFQTWLDSINREQAIIRRGKINVTTPAVAANAIVAANVAIANIAGTGLETLETGDRIIGIYYDALPIYAAPPIILTDVWATTAATMDGVFSNPTGAAWAGGAIAYYIHILKYSPTR